MVQFPDFERVGWFNDIVGQLWPYVNSAVSAMARDRLDPMLQESKPGWIRSIKLYRYYKATARFGLLHGTATARFELQRQVV